MILTTRIVQYSFWKLKGPNSSSTGVHVGREGAWSRAALKPREKSIDVNIQKAEGRIFRVGERIVWKVGSRVVVPEQCGAI